MSIDRLPGSRAVWLWAAGLVGAFVVGYVVAITAFFPAPIFARATSVPRVVGAPQEEAERSIRDAGLHVGAVTQEPHARADRGKVIWQDPPTGVAVPQGHAVDLVVSAGPQRIPVPDLSGYDAGIAERLVTAAGLRIGGTEATQAPAPAGVVINSRPPAGTTLLPGSDVTLVVSVGAPTISVPDLRGLTREEADSALVAAGLALGTAIRRTSDATEPGTVLEQSPGPGTLSAPGTTVNVTIARRRTP
jgi:serine/threonine-protein kinase